MNQLYKFRALDKNAIDILVNQRLYCPKWEILNDPHEAKILVNDGSNVNYHMNPNDLKQHGIPVEKCQTRVCSLSSTWSSNLLWSHYASGQKGVAIGVRLPEKLPAVEYVEINYDDNIPKVTTPINRKKILLALSHKSKEWKYEKEIRLVTFDASTEYVENIQIAEVIFGLRSTKDDVALVKKVIGVKTVKFYRICHKPGTYKLNKSEI